MSNVVLLIIEDEEAVAEMYATYFKQAGYAVDVAHEGTEGFTKMVSKRPSLVLMDIVMPGMGGEEVVEKAKHDPVTKNIPIVMLTNYSDSVELKNAMRQGATDYIVKSEVTPKQVVEKVQKYLKPAAVNKDNKHRYLGS